MLSLKLMLPTPINIYIQQGGTNATLIDQVQGFYDLSDMITVLVAAVVLGWSGSFILSSSSSPKAVSELASSGDGAEWNAALEKKKGAMRDIANTLKDDEAAVLRAIIASDGIIAQGELVKQTGLPKSTVSKSLDALEIRGLVERRRRGMGNMILLK